VTYVVDRGALSVELNLFALMLVEQRRDAVMNKEHKQTKTVKKAMNEKTRKKMGERYLFFMTIHSTTHIQFLDTFIIYIFVLYALNLNKRYEDEWFYI
jgi:hypothetical protein